MRGDYVELTLYNSPENMMQHNIDFHAATGALGGGSLTLVNPGEKTTLRFKATRPGTFVYHCAPGGPMIPWHVVSGMSGCIMVLPRDGLKDPEGNRVTYDRIFFILAKTTSTSRKMRTGTTTGLKTSRKAIPTRSKS